MIADLISRQAAIDAMSEALKRVFSEHRQIAEKCLNALPSAQPEIIHCEECMYRNNTGTTLNWLPCRVVATGDYWFCGSGKMAERREE